MTSVQQLKTDLRGRSRRYSWGNWKIPEIYWNERTGKGSTKHLLFFFHEGKMELLKKKKKRHTRSSLVVCWQEWQSGALWISNSPWLEWASQISHQTVLREGDCCCTPTKHRTADKYLAELEKKKGEKLLNQL